MPNNVVFTTQAQDMKVKIYGETSGGAIQALQVDSTGKLSITATNLDIRALTSADVVTVTATDFDIRPLTSADVVTVTATDFDIRPLTSADVVTVTATDFDIRPLTSSDVVTVTATDFDIRSLTAASDTISIGGHAFSDVSQAGISVTLTSYTRATSRDVSDKTMVTFAVKNTGSCDVIAKLQISPDNTSWTDDSAEVTITADQLQTFVTKTYLRYATIAYRASASASTIDIWYQAQL
ncbi:MAG: DUF6385 domain-containing protein [Bacillota bacterium]